MASPVWKGRLSFGLVSLSVRLYGARRRHGVTTHQFQVGTADRIRHLRVNERTGEEVPYDEIVKGARADEVVPEDAGADEYVMLEPEELEAIASGRSQAMEISAFVPSGSIEPIWYDSAYYLSPADASSAKPYRLLCAALQEADRLAVATLVMRDRQHMVLIGPQNGVLTLSTLWWADEIHSPQEILPALPEEEVGGHELALALRLVEAMSQDWDPRARTDDYQEQLEELVRRKYLGEEGVTHREAGRPERGTIIELTQALRESLNRKKPPAARGRRGTHGTAQGTPAQGSPPLSELSKKDLSALAAELQIPGRSTMNRRELQEAIAATGAGRRSTGSAS